MGRSVTDTSVLIPVYNGGAHLRKALLALSVQTVIPSEIVISDDGSDEDTPAVLRPVLHTVQCPVFYLRQEREAFRAAKCRNNAIVRARGRLLVFLDQDIVVPPLYIETLSRTLRDGLFITGYPVRLSERQTETLSEERIMRGTAHGVVTLAQRGKIARQFLKDEFYHHARKWGIVRAARPKLRSGVFAAWRADICAVDGFDECFIGWGNEDDDLGRRLYALGLRGKTASFTQFPLHLHHAPHHRGGTRANQPYARDRLRHIRAGDLRAVRGLSAVPAEERPQAVRLN